MLIGRLALAVAMMLFSRLIVTKNLNKMSIVPKELNVGLLYPLKF